MKTLFISLAAIALNGANCFSQVTDMYGQTYQTVVIGTQHWMAENLNTYTPNSYYYNDDSTTYAATYGRLYTQTDAINACPTGWILPSDSAWFTLEEYLGMTAIEIESDWSTNEYRGTNEGGRLKATGTSIWNDPNTGATDEFGFSALPGGFRGYGGGYDAIGQDGRYWSTGMSRYFRWDRANLNRYSSGPEYGFSVRCIDENVISVISIPADDKGILVYPNPANNSISLTSTKESAAIQVFDGFGKSHACEMQFSNGRHAIDVSALAPGIYYLIVNDGVTSQTVKFVKE